MKPNQATSADYVIRYGNESKTERTFYDTLQNIKKQFENLKKDSNVEWAEILYEPLNEEETQIVIDTFEKIVIDFFGQRVVFNIG